MAQTIKFNNDELLEAAKRQKEYFSRSLNGQLEHWARLGRFVEESGLFDLHKVNLAFQGKIPFTELNAEEEAAHNQMLWQSLEQLDGSDETVLREIEQAGGIIYGLDKQGNIKESRHNPE